MTNNKVQFVGAPCGQHGSYSFYKGFRYTLNGKPRILALGEFVLLKIWADEDIISIGEPQLIWEDRASSNMLVSLRLYFMPENTPDGRAEEHGEHEVICLSEKVVIRAEDLISLVRSAAEVKWHIGLRGVYGREPCHVTQLPAQLTNTATTNNNNNSSKTSKGGLSPVFSTVNSTATSCTTTVTTSTPIKCEPLHNVKSELSPPSSDTSGVSEGKYDAGLTGNKFVNHSNSNTNATVKAEVGVKREGCESKYSSAITAAIENCKTSNGSPATLGLPETMYYPPPVMGALDIREIRREKKIIGDVIGPDTVHPIILSYDRYCRMRCLLARLGQVESSMRSAVVQALGGFLVPSRNTLMLFCRDVFDYPELEGHDLLCNHLAPKLQGRPRKKHKKRSLSTSGGLNNSAGGVSETDSSEETNEDAKPAPHKLKGKPGLTVPPKPGLTTNKPNSLRSLDRKAKPNVGGGLILGGLQHGYGLSRNSCQAGAGNKGNAGGAGIRGSSQSTTNTSKPGSYHHHHQQQQQDHGVSGGITCTANSSVSSPTITSTSGKQRGNTAADKNNTFLNCMQATLKQGQQAQPDFSTPALNRLIEVDFMSKLHKYMRDRNTPITRLPHIGYRQLNVFELFSKVQQLGGYDAVCSKKQWKLLYDQLAGPPHHPQQQNPPTSCANVMRRHYERLLYPYEKFLLNEQKRLYGAEAAKQLQQHQQQQQQHQQMLQSVRNNNHKKQADNEPSVSILQHLRGGNVGEPGTPTTTTTTSTATVTPICITTITTDDGVPSLNKNHNSSTAAALPPPPPPPPLPPPPAAQQHLYHQHHNQHHLSSPKFSGNSSGQPVPSQVSTTSSCPSPTASHLLQQQPNLHLTVPKVSSVKKDPAIPADLAKRPEITITPIPRSLNDTLAGVAAAAAAANNPLSSMLGAAGVGFPSNVSFKALGLDIPELSLMDFNAIASLADIAKKYDKSNHYGVLAMAAATAAAAATSAGMTSEPAAKRFKPDDTRVNGARDGGGNRYPQDRDAGSSTSSRSLLDLRAAASEMSKLQSLPDLVSADFLRSMNMLDSNAKLLMPAHQSTKTINALAALLPQTSIFPAPAPAAHQQNSTRSPMKTSQCDSPRPEPPRVFQSQSLYAQSNRVYDKPTVDVSSSPKEHIGNHRELSKSSSPEIEILDLRCTPSSLGSGSSSSSGKNGKSYKPDRLDVELLDLSTRRDITVSAVPKPNSNKHSRLSNTSSLAQISLKSTDGITITPNHSSTSNSSRSYRGCDTSSINSSPLNSLAGLSSAELNNLLSGMPGAALIAAAASASQGLQGLHPSLASLGLSCPSGVSLPPSAASLLPFLMSVAGGGVVNAGRASSPSTSKSNNSSLHSPHVSFHNSSSSSGSPNSGGGISSSSGGGGLPPMFPYLDPNSLASYYSSLLPHTLLQPSTSTAAAAAAAAAVTSLSSASLSSASLAAAQQAAAVQMAHLNSLGLGSSLSGLPSGLSGPGSLGSPGGNVTPEALANLGMYKNFLGGAAAASSNNSSNVNVMPPPHFLAPLMSPGTKPKK